MRTRTLIARTLIAPLVAVLLGACRGPASPAAPRATGYVEATEIRVAAKVAGRVTTVEAVEGARVAAGATLATLATTDVDFALQRARADRARAIARRPAGRGRVARGGCAAG